MRDPFEWKAVAYGRRKLSDADVRSIRRMAIDGMTYSAIQRMFPGVAKETVARIVRRETHTNVADALPVEPLIKGDDSIEEMIRQAEEARKLSAEALLEEAITIPKNPFDEED